MNTDSDISPPIGADQPPDSKQGVFCRYCRTEIDRRAKVCFQCGRNQNGWMNLTGELNLLSLLATAVSILLLILAFRQLKEAQNERIAAAEALKEARAAKSDVSKTAQNLQKVVRAVVENSYILGSESF